MIRTFLSIASGGLVIAAHAQSASAQASGDAAPILTRNAADLTCSDLVAKDDESTRNLLYYVAGYTAADAKGDDTAAVPGEGAEEPAHALGPTGSDNETAATPSGGSDAALLSIGGFQINVEQALANCEAAPETRLVDLLDEQRRSVD